MTKRINIYKKIFKDVCLWLLTTVIILMFVQVSSAQTLDTQNKEESTTATPQNSDTQSKKDYLAGIESILAKADKAENSGQYKSASDNFKSYLRQVSAFTQTQTNNKEDIISAINNADKYLERMKKNNYISEEEYTKLQNTLAQAARDAKAYNVEYYTDQGKENKADRYERKISKAITKVLQGCPTTEQLRAKYEAGCWSCLVIGNLTEAFLGAADNGMGVTKKAGLVVLWVGTGIWLVFWGLKNVSSFTQIQLGNILNELLKFLFKVMLAYWVIIYSNNVLSQYLITPIMSVGSTIGQMFWHGDTKSFTTDYNSETEETDTGGVKYTTYEEIAKEIESSISDSGYPSIFPKSVMDSMLGAIASITYKMSDIMVLGNSVMCYAGLENGGAINIKAFNVTLMSMPNFFIWISGCIIWCLGFLLIWAVGYYFLDISFKIGFAVLAFPIVMGLWPFNMTQGKLFIIISIIAKSAALFAFLALMTGFGLSLFGESATVGGLDTLFEKLDSITLGTATEEMEEQVNNEINDAIYLFSPIFVTMVFALIYFYKLVQQTSSDLVNKFFPDNAFGDSSPMHSTATMMTDYTRKMVTSITGANLAKDIVANQAGIGIKKLMQGTGRAIRHPQQTARNIASKFKGKSSGNGK